MRKISEIIIHCSATIEGKDFTVADIDRWHRQRGYKCIGYHYVIYRDGSVHEGRPLERIGSHCKGHNAYSIGICYIGGLGKDGKPKDTRTPQQINALLTLLNSLRRTYPLAKVRGHNELSAKSCPCFNVNEFVREVIGSGAP